MIDILEILGALLILAAFAASQVGWLDARSRAYLVLNLAGSALLAVIAAIGSSWGFLLLEGVWAVVSLISLVAALRRAPATGRR